MSGQPAGRFNPTTPLEVVRHAYEAWAEQDYVEVLCTFDPRVNLHYEDGLPYRGDFVGREVVARIVRETLADWDWLEIEPRAYSSKGGLIAVVGIYEARGKATGFAFRDPFTHIWEVARGRAVRAAFYRSAADALRDLDHEVASGTGWSGAGLR